MVRAAIPLALAAAVALPAQCPTERAVELEVAMTLRYRSPET